MRLMATSSRGPGQQHLPAAPDLPDVPDVPGVVFGRLRYGRLGRTLRARPVLVDSMLAVAVGLVALLPYVAPPRPRIVGILLLTFAAVAPLCLRRRYPVGALVVSAAACYAQVLLWIPSFGTFSSLLIEFYTVAKWCSRRVAAVSALAVVVWILWFSFRIPDVRTTGRAAVMLVFLPAAVAAGVLGGNANTRRAYVASIADRALRAERERDQQARLAAAGERARIAREMHDIVAHNLSVMIALADGASYTLRDLVATTAAPAALAALEPSVESEPPVESRTSVESGTPVATKGDERVLLAARAVESVSATGREALAQMRSLLGVLRDDAGPVRSSTTDAGAPHETVGLGDVEPAVVQHSAAADGSGRGGRDGRDGGYATSQDEIRDEFATAPQPRLADLDRLINQVRLAGRTVGFLVLGERHELPADAELTIFRIVQESLTNVLKHAETEARAVVRLAFDADGVDVEITNSCSAFAGETSASRETAFRETASQETAASANPALSRPSGRGVGRGIEGMRERAALHGGRLVAGPIDGAEGGWRVSARINAPAAHRPPIATQRLAVASSGQDRAAASEPPAVPPAVTKLRTATMPATGHDQDQGQDQVLGGQAR